MTSKVMVGSEYYKYLLEFCQDGKIEKLKHFYDIPNDILNWLRPHIVRAYKNNQKKENMAIYILYALCTKTEYGTNTKHIIDKIMILGWSPNQIFNMFNSIKYIRDTNNIRTTRILDKFIIMVDDMHIPGMISCGIGPEYIKLLDFYNTLFWNSPVCCDFLIEGVFSEIVYQPGIKKKELEAMNCYFQI